MGVETLVKRFDRLVRQIKAYQNIRYEVRIYDPEYNRIVREASNYAKIIEMIQENNIISVSRIYLEYTKGLRDKFRQTIRDML